jgi:hypothetical protein
MAKAEAKGFIDFVTSSPKPAKRSIDVGYQLAKAKAKAKSSIDAGNQLAKPKAKAKSKAKAKGSIDFATLAQA